MMCMLCGSVTNTFKIEDVDVLILIIVINADDLLMLL